MLSFFISRHLPNRQDPFIVASTLSYQLASAHQPARDIIIDAISSTDKITTKRMSEQVARLIQAPLEAVIKSHNYSSGAPRLLILLDALDEGTDFVGGPGQTLLQGVVQAIATSSGRAKLFLTSRSEPAMETLVTDIFGTSKLERQACRLHDLDHSVVQADISTYLRAEFARMVETHADVPSGWPTEAEFNQALEHSGGFFLAAATLVRFVDNSLFPGPRKRLHHLLAAAGRRVDAAQRSPYAQLDAVYTQVLDSATEDDDRRAPSNTALRGILVCIFFAAVPVSVGMLTAVIDIEHDELMSLLNGLASVLLLPTSFDEDDSAISETSSDIMSVTSSWCESDFQSYIRPFHPSFQEFITDPRRCTVERFYVSSEDIGHLAQRCLHVLNTIPFPRRQERLTGNRIWYIRLDDQDAWETQNMLCGPSDADDPWLRQTPSYSDDASGTPEMLCGPFYADNPWLRGVPSGLKFATLTWLQLAARSSFATTSQEMDLMVQTLEAFCQIPLMHWAQTMRFRNNDNLRDDISKFLAMCMVGRTAEV